MDLARLLNRPSPQGSASRFSVLELEQGELTERVVTTRALDDTGDNRPVGAAGGRVEARFGDLTGRERRSEDDFVVTVISLTV